MKETSIKFKYMKDFPMNSNSNFISLLIFSNPTWMGKIVYVLLNQRFNVSKIYIRPEPDKAKYKIPNTHTMILQRQVANELKLNQFGVSSVVEKYRLIQV